MTRLALAALLATACAPPVSACVTPYTARAGVGTTTACRQDVDRAACAREGPGAVFTAGRSCADVGYPCLHDALGAVLSEARDRTGACPSGTTAVR